MDAKKLYVSELHFVSFIQMIEKYWKTESSLVYMTCCKIGHKRIEGCKNQSAKYIICANMYKIKKYQYKVVGYTKSKKKICPHIKVKYANCRRNYMINIINCTLRWKASVKVSKRKKFRRNCEKKNKKVIRKDGNSIRERDISPKPEAKIDLKTEN